MTHTLMVCFLVLLAMPAHAFRLLVYGDSHSQGIVEALVGPAGCPSCPTTMPDGMVPSTVTIVDEAVNAETSTQGLARVAAVVANGPYDAAVISYGTNDVLLAAFGFIPPAQGEPSYIVTNLLAIQAALVMGGSTHVYLAEPPGSLITTTNTAIARAGRAAIYDIGHRLRAVGETLSYTTLQDPVIFAGDNLHLKRIGYEMLAMRILTFLREKGLPV